MGDFLDGLARSLAEPMPRGRAVRVLAAAAVSAALPLARPGLAGALPERQQRAAGCAPNLRQCDGTGGKDIACCGPSDTCCRGGRDSIGNLQVACCPAGTTCCVTSIYPYCCQKSEVCGKKKPRCAPGGLCKYSDPYVKSIERERSYDPATECCTKDGVQPKDGDFNLSYCAETLTPREGYKVKANGCGSNGIKVPDTWRKASFLKACNAHDRCYGTCGADKGECDRSFKENLLSACGKAYREGSATYGQCTDRAGVYYDAVSGSGYFGVALGSFQQAQREACQCCK